jgi:hypothetical protein
MWEKYPHNNKKAYFNKFNKPNKFSNSNFKGESNSRPFEKKNLDADKRCFYCKKLGHLIKDCRNQIATEKRNNQSNMVTQSHKLYVVKALIAKEYESESTWYVDSGATQHMCH